MRGIVAVGSTTNEKARDKLQHVACLSINRAALQRNGAGTGTVVYPNKDKYEGDWLNGKRHGVGALWLYDSDRYRIRYTGKWQKDRFHVSPELPTPQPVHLLDHGHFLVKLLEIL